jgi:anthranilate phosphoribosyltransferase
MSLQAALQRVCDRQNLTSAEAAEAMRIILSGEGTPALIAAFAVALRMKGETVDEVVGLARTMRQMATSVDTGISGEPLLDTCGTGGASAATFNVSTVAAFVVAGAGVRVAKHGNRSFTGLCGSADLMEGLGVKIQQTPERIAAAIREVGIGFLFAPAIHGAMKHAAPVRAELKIRTVFNLLGPLTNPAGANVQLVGTPTAQAAELVAGALAALGVERAMVVHGSDGLDEITTTATTLAFDVRGSTVARRTLRPSDFGVPSANAADIKGADKPRSVDIARRVLSGALGPQRDIVLVNASAALVVAGKAPNFLAGVRKAAESIDSGAARAKLEALIRFTSSSPSGA